jgi:hypothetical protein
VSNPEGDKPDFDETLEPLSPEGAFPPDEPGEMLEPLEPLGDTEPGEGPETLEPLEPVGEYAEPAPGGPEALEPMPVVGGTEGEVLEPVEEPEEPEKPKGPGLLARLVPTPYVALLGIAVLALLMGVLWLWLELKRYNLEFKPPQASTVPVVQTDWPTITSA